MPESVWDYPRPPRLEREPRRVRIIVDDQLIAETTRALRVLETSHPPTIYLPRRAFRPGVLHDTPGSSRCEFKGVARYHDLTVGDRRIVRAGWSYPTPAGHFGELAGHVAIYPGRVDEAWLGDEQVRAQDGDFYGGWITSELVGPFKGSQGTRCW